MKQVRAKQRKSEIEKPRDLVTIVSEKKDIANPTTSRESHIPLSPAVLVAAAAPLVLLSRLPSSLPAATPPFLGFRFSFTSLPLARRQPAGHSFCAPSLSSSLPHLIPLVWILLLASVFCSAVDDPEATAVTSTTQPNPITY